MRRKADYNNEKDTTGGKEENTVKEDETTAAENSNFVWPVKDVTAPDIPEIEQKQEVICTTEKGQVNINILQSFLTEENFDRAAAKEELKKNPLFKDLIFADTHIEKAEVEIYSDVGQLQKYEYEYQIGAAKYVDDNTEFFTDITVSYEGDTSSFNGFETISLDIDVVNSENLTEDKLQYVYDAVKTVFGEKYTDFLMYAPVDKNGIIIETEQENCNIRFIRSVSEYGLIFQIKIIGNNYNGNDYYKGNYEPVIGKTPNKIYEVFSSGIGSFDMMEYDKISSEMLVQFFANYKQTSPDRGEGYRYRQTIADNGHAVYDFSIDAKVTSEDFGGVAAPQFEVEYNIKEKEGKVTDVYGYFRTGVAALDEDIDVATEKAKYLENAKIALKLILGDKAPETIEFDVNNLRAIQYKTDVLGIESNIYLGYEFGQTMVGAHQAYAVVKID